MSTRTIATIVLFHSAYGLRPGFLDFAARLRADGHAVHTPDLFDGKIFDRLEDGVQERDRLGVPELIARAHHAVAHLPTSVIYVGWSMGTGPAELLAATRPGARGLVLMHGALAPAAIGVEVWPASLPVQVHATDEDPWVDESAIAALEQTGQCTVFRYRGRGHLFADAGLPEYDEASATMMIERVLTFVRSR